MKLTKEEITGWTGSLLFCLLLLLILYFIVLRAEIQKGEEGILVNFGTVDWSSGTVEPRAQGPDRIIPQEETSPPERIPIQAPEEAPPVITQETEETIALQAAQREREKEEKRRREEQEAEQRRLAEEKRKAEEEQRRREAINQQISGAFGAGTSDQSQEGTAESGTGNQGSSEGNAPVGAYQGVGGQGTFDLAGRTLGPGGLPRPDYSVQVEGTIVIDITVDSKGVVIYSEIGRGTNIDNATMRRDALNAARKANFNSISGANNQSGTITYKYKLN